MTSTKTGFSIRIGDVTARLHGKGIPLEIPAIYHDFVVPESRVPDIDIDVYYSEIPEIKPDRLVFDSGSFWRLYEWQGKHLFIFASSLLGPDYDVEKITDLIATKGLASTLSWTSPRRIAAFSPDFSRGELFIRRDGSSPTAVEPLQYPLDELMFINYLSLGRGLEVHALGIAFDATGLAFLGVSGAGKSTLAELWKKRDVRILSDDRIIFRKKEGIFQMYGTPWHGDAKISLAQNVPLKNIYFLKQAKVNRILPLELADAATRLIVRCFPTLYYVHGMEFTLEFASDLVQTIPCYELQFAPDERTIDGILDHVKNK